MRRHKLFYGSSYDRGLDMLLPMWPQVLKAYPDAQLHICYGWDMFNKAATNNVERQDWKKKVIKLMDQPGIHHHGRVGQEELAKIRRQCGIWAYPTYFTEINCITGLQAQHDGLVPVTMTLGALDETVQAGIKVDGDIKKKEVQVKYLEELLKAMGDRTWWRSESKKAQKHAENYYWDKIADKWLDEFETSFEPKVSIITPTIRQGFWNIMANNIASQTYKNIEWIVVDDFPADRSKVAKHYAELYGIDIKYTRTKQAVKRFYALSSANNTGWKVATGELLVWLQDFVIMPNTGIEKMVDIYRLNPDALIAGVDQYHKSKIKPDTDSEDWFNGEVDVIGELMRKNIRQMKRGLIESKQPIDFEMNYGAIPKHILDYLNGFWEFFDEALGFDNTEIAFRALLSGNRLLVDDTNIAICLDHWEPLEDKPEQLGKERTVRLNDPRFHFLRMAVKSGKLSVVRDETIDQTIDLQYTNPKSDQKGATKWIQKNAIKIAKQYYDDFLSNNP